jgi:hypothetical protein
MAMRGWFKKTWKAGSVAKSVKLFTAPFIFVAGAVLSHFIDVGLGDLDAAWIVVGALALSLMALTIVLVSWFAAHEQMAGEQRKHEKRVFDEIKGLAERLDVSAKLIPEHDGETYTATTELIRKASKSLVFVDIWVATDPAKPYLQQGTRQAEARSEYYEAIVTWLGQHLANNADGPCYRRIIQLDRDVTADTLESDATTFEHVRACAALEHQNPGAAVIQRADKQFWSNVVIIDDRYVVHTLLVTKEGRPHRHAAMLYDDPQEKIVPSYKKLVERLKPSSLELDAMLLEHPAA